jgi:hypothetical protein
MPAQPAWFHRLLPILETLRGMERARQIIAGLDGLRVGGLSQIRLRLGAAYESECQKRSCYTRHYC